MPSKPPKQDNQEEPISLRGFNQLLTSFILVIVAVCLIFLVILWLDRYDTPQQNNLPTEKEDQNSQLSNSASTNDVVENGIHVPTGLKVGEGYEIVQAACLTCHSAKLITQNRATREGWHEMILWMQATQGLGNLGNMEPIILDYLATNYAPDESSRRPVLNPDQIEWYILNTD